MCLRQSTRFMVVRQTWISPLAPNGPENSNTNELAPTWSWILAWLVCPSHHATLAVVFASAATHFILYVTHSEPLFWVYLCYLHLSGILVGKYLCPFEFLMGKYLCICAIRCKMVNWLFTLGYPVQTNTDRSFLVVFEVVYVVWWYKYKYNSLARMLSNNVKNITRV